MADAELGKYVASNLSFPWLLGSRKGEARLHKFVGVIGVLLVSQETDPDMVDLEVVLAVTWLELESGRWNQQVWL